ncbi:MAG TPA: alpha/beta hydrolase-fold protein [Nitriliruptorales bacterium]
MLTGRVGTLLLAAAITVGSPQLAGEGATIDAPPIEVPEPALGGAGPESTPPRAAVASQDEASSDGARFDGWNVTVRTDPGYANEQILEVAFDSPVLGLRTIMLVWLPDRYAGVEEPLPTLYYLHGTTHSNSFGVAQELAEQGVDAPAGLRPGSGRGSPFGVGFHENLDEQQFVVVAPDMQFPAWCGHCWWIDGRDGQGVDAETHLFEEVVPLTEHLFGVRSDRSGRAILGASMGANGALLQAFRHPDRFAFVGGLSPTYSGFGHAVPPFLQVHGGNIWWQYIQDQGYGHPAQDEIHYRALEPVNLTPQMLSADVEIVAVNGDGCLPVAPDEGACENADPHLEEFIWHHTMGVWSSLLVERGVEHTWIEREGPHGGINRDSYERWFLPRINQRFAEGVDTPERFSYRTIDLDFDIWGYEVQVDRTNTEFLSLLDAGTDGRALTLAGTGVVTLRTPPVVDRGRRDGRTYEVTGTPDSAPAWTQTVVTDDEGRLTFTFELAPGRDVDERIELVQTGAFVFPRTRIAITPIE